MHSLFIHIIDRATGKYQFSFSWAKVNIYSLVLAFIPNPVKRGDSLKHQAVLMEILCLFIGLPGMPLSLWDPERCLRCLQKRNETVHAVHEVLGCYGLLAAECFGFYFWVMNYFFVVKRTSDRVATYTWPRLSEPLLSISFAWIEILERLLLQTKATNGVRRTSAQLGLEWIPVPWTSFLHRSLWWHCQSKRSNKHGNQKFIENYQYFIY